ncbi:phosphoribosylformylglycinamidine synthase [Riemerella anatipestifer]|uniref:HAEPLYID family protein n=1 Tax=Riemerella anatipestifer TaxID=34085 RepID=UPI0030C52A94
MNLKKIMLLALGLIFGNVFSQNHNNEKDSLYIAEVEERKEPAKVLHAEPLYIDLIRDLGARKGEKEWNLGLGLTDKLNFDAYEALVEYEWAPIDRLGLEVELPFTFYSPTGGMRGQAPSSKLNSLKLALQWSFLVNEEKAMSMALGYINELEFSDFGRFGKPLIKGNVYNPFFVVAKRWGNNFHTLFYTGPMIEQSFINNKFHMVYEVHSSFHYMISGTRNFVGVEFNKTFDRGNFDMVMRPQMRLGISEQLMLGVVVGIPVSRENERLSSFLRLIWEPKH